MAHKSQDELKKDLEEAQKVLSVGQKYAHYKHLEQHYQVEFLGFLESTDELVVGYRALYGDGFLFVRPLVSFVEEVKIEGKKMLRFTPM